MTKSEAKRRFIEYLEKEQIPYQLINENDKLTSFDDINSICISCGKQADRERIETLVRFEDEYCYCQSYFCEPIINSEQKAIKAVRMIAYLNTHLYWDCNELFEHGYYFNEDDPSQTIVNGCLLRFELMDLYFNEAVDHILNFSVQQLKDIYKPLMLHLDGKYSYEQFKDYLNRHILM